MPRKRRATYGEAATERVTIYLTPSEKQQIQQRAINVSLSDYFRRAGLEQLPPSVPEIHWRIYRELAHINSHLQQIARACQRTATEGSQILVQESWFQELHKQLRQTQQQLLNSPDSHP